MVLTTADVAIAAAAAAIATATERNPTKRKSEDEKDLPGIDVVGPSGTRAFLHSLRHFMRRDKFQMRITEGDYHQSPGEDGAMPDKPKKRTQKGRYKHSPEPGFYVQTIPLVYRWKRSAPFGKPYETEVLSYVFTTPPILGKFLPEKAKELGIRPGPLYAKLKKGEAVTIVDKNNVERTIESHQVVTKTSPGVAVAIIYCPSLDVLKQLEQATALERLRQKRDNSPVLDVMIHMTSRRLFYSNDYQDWVQTFPSELDHLWLESVPNLADNEDDRLSKARDRASPFHSASVEAQTRSLIHSGIFPSPVSSLHANETDTLQANSLPGTEAVDKERFSEYELKVIEAKPSMEYKLIPRSKKGLSLTENATTETSNDTTVAMESGAVELAKSIATELSGFSPTRSIESNEDGEFVFTGSGSAIPCKQRNVTGMYMRMKNGNGLLLDVGEGTLGQLLRAKGRRSMERVRELVQSITAVWISHPHADHHLGLLRFLTERNHITNNPVVVMAPPNLFAFLAEYEELDPSMKGSYVQLDCRDLDPKMHNRLGDKLFQDLGVTRIVSVPVAHCPHSYAVIIDGTPFGRVAYSGDCRPSMAFADAGADADLLIHEATFEDGMEEEATLKRHCTVGEALMVAKRMRAKAVALTHFSQRYPRIPPLRQPENGLTDISECDKYRPDIVLAFDFMTLTPGTVALAAALTPALRMLYPTEEEEAGSQQATEDDAVSSSMTTSEILSVPGLFAQQDLL